MSLVIAETPAALLERLAADLAAVRDPRARHWLVLPGRGRGEWVQRRWAEHSGIASRSQLLSVRALLELVAAGDDEADDQRPFSLDDLALRIAAVLPAYRDRLPAALAAEPLAAEAPIDGRRLAWARQLADALDMAWLCRPPGRRCANDPGLTALAADPLVGAALARHLGALDEAAMRERIGAWCRRWQARDGLPHLWIQLDVGLPEVMSARLAQLAAELPLDRLRLYALSPSLGWWGDLRTGRRRGPVDEDPGPLLRAFGRRAQDLQNQLADRYLAEGPGEETLESPEPEDRLLGRLQRSARDPDLTPPSTPLPTDDDSFTVHACRSPLRELETCRDRILAAMAADPSLRPGEVLLLLADPAAYAPLVAAALQPQATFDQRLPFRLLATTGSAPAPVADAVWAVVAAITGRCDQERLLELLEQPLIAERFGLAHLAEDGVDCLSWLQEARFGWGLDAEHRAAHRARDDGIGSLAFALRRLALGAVVAPEDLSRVVGGAVPLDRAAGLSTGILARLADLAERLAETRRDWARTEADHSAGWCGRIRHLIETFLGPGQAVHEQQRSALLNGILPELAATSLDDAPLVADGFLRLLRPRLDELASGVGGGGAGVVVAPLTEAAGTPARMVLICGLGQDRFPRRDERPLWHPLAGARAPGDPDRRDDDRHHLLLALLGAGERLVCTYTGGSDLDAQPRPPSTPLADLLAAAAACCPPDHRSRLEYRHPLNGFSPAAHDAALPPAARSAVALEARGARALLAGKRRAPGGLWTAPLPPEPAAAGREIDAAELLLLVREPCRLLLARLGIRLGETISRPEAGDRFDLDGLEAWRERERLIRTRLAGGDEGALHERQRLAGHLPPGRYGSEAWAEIAASAPGWDAAADPLTRLADAPPCRLSAADGASWILHPLRHQAWYRDRAERWHRFSATRRRPSRRPAPAADDLPHLVELLVETAARDGGAPTRIHFAEGGRLDLEAPPPDTARALLGDLIALHHLARRLPLPWWPACHAALTDPAAEPTRRLEAAATAYAGGADAERSGRPPPALWPATRRCFRDCEDPLAWSGPDAELPLPEPGAALALRCASAFEAWYRAAAAACALGVEREAGS